MEEDELVGHAPVSRPTADMLVEAIAEEYGMEKRAGVCGGRIRLMSWPWLFMAFFNSEWPILFPDITYSF